MCCELEDPRKPLWVRVVGSTATDGSYTSEEKHVPPLSSCADGNMKYKIISHDWLKCEACQWEHGKKPSSSKLIADKADTFVCLLVLYFIILLLFYYILFYIIFSIVFSLSIYTDIPFKKRFIY